MQTVSMWATAAATVSALRVHRVHNIHRRIDAQDRVRGDIHLGTRDADLCRSGAHRLLRPVRWQVISTSALLLLRLLFFFGDVYSRDASSALRCSTKLVSLNVDSSYDDSVSENERDPMIEANGAVFGVLVGSLEQ